MIPIDDLLYQYDMRLEVCQNLLLSICSGILSHVGDIFKKNTSELGELEDPFHGLKPSLKFICSQEPYIYICTYIYIQ